MFDVEKVRQDFPLLQNRKIIYFDNACTTLKAQKVVDAITDYYTNYSGCAGRSVHAIAIKTEEEFEGSRKAMAKFIGADTKEVVWTKNTTEGINLIANSFGFKEGDGVVTTNIEHHSVILPFQRMAQSGNIKLDFAFANKDGSFNIGEWEKKINDNTRLVVVHHTTNTLGTTAPLKEIIKIAHRHGAKVLVDGAQGVPHYEMDVKKLDVDFLAFSGHKMLGPTGIGCLYGKYRLLDEMSPFIVGGETIKEVKLESAVYENPPHRFEAGIQHYAGAIGLAAAARYLDSLGMKNVESHEKALAKQLLEGLASIRNVEIYGPTDYNRKCALVAFNVKGSHPHDVALLFDQLEKIAVRSGVFCAQPAMEHLGALQGAVRASLYLYNTVEEIALFLETLKKIMKTIV